MSVECYIIVTVDHGSISTIYFFISLSVSKCLQIRFYSFPMFVCSVQWKSFIVPTVLGQLVRCFFSDIYFSVTSTNYRYRYFDLLKIFLKLLRNFENKHCFQLEISAQIADSLYLPMLLQRRGNPCIIYNYYFRVAYSCTLANVSLCLRQQINNYANDSD